MRMWMINPRALCRNHLLGEHNELHKHLPSFRKGHKVHGRFYPVVQIQFPVYQQRHDDLATEMERRGYTHQSPLVGVPDFQEIYPEYWSMKVDIARSYTELMDRCPDCCERIKGDLDD